MTYSAKEMSLEASTWRYIKSAVSPLYYLLRPTYFTVKKPQYEGEIVKGVWFSYDFNSDTRRSVPSKFVTVRGKGSSFLGYTVWSNYFHISELEEVKMTRKEREVYELLNS